MSQAWNLVWLPIRCAYSPGASMEIFNSVRNKFSHLFVPKIYQIMIKILNNEISQLIATTIQKTVIKFILLSSTSAH